MATQPGQFYLLAEPTSLRVGQTALLRLFYTGTQAQQFYFRAESADLNVEVVPAEGYVQPGQAVNAVLHTRGTRPYWLGGEFPVTVYATTSTGLDALTEVTVHARPRYELLLLLLLLLCLPVTALALAATGNLPGILQAAPTATATFTPTLTESVISTTTAPPSATITSTASDTPAPTDTAGPPTSTLIPSRTLTSTFTPSPTRPPPPTVTPCFNQCAALGWQTYRVQPGDTLGRLSQLAGVSVSDVQRVNCLPNINEIAVGMTICFPRLPITDTPFPTNTPFAPSPTPFEPAPVAAFNFDPLGTPTCEIEVLFVNLSQNANQFVWQFGDGSPSVSTDSQAELTHVYSSNRGNAGTPLTFTVTLTASRGELSNTTSRQVTITFPSSCDIEIN